MKNYYLMKYITILALLFFTSQAWAVFIGFDGISNNDVGDTGIGESQLGVDVTDAGGGLVKFHFTNAGPLASSITDTYFDDGSLLAIAQIIDSDDGVGGDLGVDFSQLASPSDLPAGNNASPPFTTTAGFSADSDPPTQPNGVNPGEFLDIIFSLQGGQTFADVINELNSGALRIGIHVQGFASGGSESFVNTPPDGPPPQETPEPGILLLLAAGLAGLGLSRRRRV